MSKLQFKTVPPTKHCIKFKTESIHERKNIKDRLPPEHIQDKALHLVTNVLDNLITQLGDMGYDMTQARFSIHYV